MATSRNDQMVVPGSENSFFSGISSVLSAIQQATAQGRSIYENVAPIWTGPVLNGSANPPKPEPTFQGPSTGTTASGSLVARDWTPWLVAAGVGMVGLLLVVRR